MTFEVFYEKFYPRVHKYIYTRTGDIHDADDITNDVFIAAYKSFGSFDASRCSYQTWIYVIAKNRLKNYYRDRRPVFSIEEMDEDIPGGDEVEQAAFLCDAREKLAALLSGTDEIKRKILIYKYFLGYSSQEIADKLGMTPGNVRITMARTLKKFNETMRKEGDDDIL